MNRYFQQLGKRKPPKGGGSRTSMKKASLFLSAIGATAFTCGGAGLDGPTPVGCVIVLLAGAVLVASGITLNVMDKIKKQEQAKAKSEQEQRKNELIKVWKACQM